MAYSNLLRNVQTIATAFGISDRLYGGACGRLEMGNGSLAVGSIKWF
ncbi:hypothetical protein [Chitinophaga sp.]